MQATHCSHSFLTSHRPKECYRIGSLWVRMLGKEVLYCIRQSVFIRINKNDRIYFQVDIPFLCLVCINNEEVQKEANAAWATESSSMYVQLCLDYCQCSYLSCEKCPPPFKRFKYATWWNSHLNTIYRLFDSGNRAWMEGTTSLKWGCGHCSP